MQLQRSNKFNKGNKSVAEEPINQTAKFLIEICKWLQSGHIRDHQEVSAVCEAQYGLILVIFIVVHDLTSSFL